MLTNLDFLEFCLDRARWCILHSEEPYIAALAWLKTFESNLDIEIKTLY